MLVPELFVFILHWSTFGQPAPSFVISSPCLQSSTLASVWRMPVKVELIGTLWPENQSSVFSD